MMEVICVFSFRLFCANWERFPKERYGYLTCVCLALTVVVSLGVDHFSFVSHFFAERRDFEYGIPGHWVKTMG